MQSRSARAKTRTNRYEGLSVEPTEPDDSNASSGARSRGHHTRSSPPREENTLPPLERVKLGLSEAIHIIHAIPNKSEWWMLASTRICDALQPTLELVTSLVQKHNGSTSEVQEARMPNPVQDVMPGPTSPDVSLFSAFCPQQPLTAQDVEAAIARALPAILTRELKDIRDTLQTGQTTSTNGALWPRAAPCCSTNHRPNPPPPPPPQPTERDVFVSLAGVPRSDAVHALSELEVKVLVDSNLARTALKGTSSPAVHGVKKLANGNLRIRTTSEDVRDALVKEPTGWLQALGAGAQLARDRYPVEVRAVPATFRPGEEYSIQSVYQANAGVFPAATSIVSMRWLREPSPDKQSASLIMELASLKALSNAVYFGISIRGRTCDAVPFIPSPTQCFYCQGWGHTVNACPRKKDLLPITCARCAGPHATGACSCPHSTRCSSLRTCKHIAVRCANCGGCHKSFSVDCPTRQRAAAEVARMPRYARLLAAYSSSPSHSGGVPASDTLRSLPFSDSPRAGSAWRD